MNGHPHLFLLVSTCLLLSVGGLPVSAQRPAGKPYRVIFNCDGYGVFVDAKGNVDAYIQNVFGPLEGSHVDALFWCDGAGGNTASYDSEVLERTGARINQVDPTLSRWIEEGNDPPQVVVREAHKRKLDVFYSFRVNDIHDSHLPKEFPTFKQEHPEWMLGDQFEEFTTSLNFAIPEVRELKLRTIEEIFDKYDFDGIELDLMRFPRFFVEFLEYRNSFVLTDFMRTVRQKLNERARQRGRAIKVAVRVDENLVACQLNGFDVETWIDEDLIDILIVGDYAFPSGQDIQRFRELTEGKPVQLYVCVAHPSKVIGGADHTHGGGTTVLRGLATNYWSQGADGMYTFNLFPHSDHLSYQAQLLKEIGDPQVLATKDKIFPADSSEYGPGKNRHHPSSPRFHNWMFASLPVTLHPVWNASSMTVIPLEVADDFSSDNAQNVESLQLWIELKNLGSGDVIDFSMNGHSLKPDPQPEAGSLVKLNLRPDQLQAGRNEVGLWLNKRGPKSENQVIVDSVEIHVDYQ